MSLWQNLKALFSSQPYFGATITERDGYGNKGSKPRPFEPNKAWKEFRHWAYAAAMLNANAVANVPLRLYVRRRGGEKLYRTRKVDKSRMAYLTGDSSDTPSRGVMSKVAEFGYDVEEIVDTHPALQVLRTVNPYFNGYELTTLRMLDLQYTGNAYLQVVLAQGLGIPAELWRMAPQITSVKPSKSNWVAGYIYGHSPSEREFAPDDVIHFKLPNPKDNFYGMGWVEAAWQALNIHASKREMDQAKFDNMGVPDYLIAVKGGPANKEALDRLEHKLARDYGGAKGRGKAFAVGADLTVNALNVDVPEIGTPTRVIEEISAVSGVPVAMLLTNDPTKAGSQTARVGWYRSTIRPYCRLDEEKLNEKYIPLFGGGEEMFLAYDQVSFEDSEAQAKRVIGLVSGGILTPNEARAEMFYDPQPDADKLLPPSGTTAGAAAVAGNLSPGQNDDRQNEQVMQ